MARQLNLNAANYLSHDNVNLGMNGATEGSWAMWLKTDAAAAAVRLIFTKRQRNTPTDDGTLGFYADASLTKVKAFMESGDFAQQPVWDSPALTVGVWTRVLFTFKRNLITTADGLFYFNGVLQTTDSFQANGYAAGFTMGENTNSLLIGVGESLTNPWSGSLDWLSIWNRQLTAQEARLDFVNPRNVRSGLLSSIRLGGVDQDQGAIGGNMTVNGSCPEVDGPQFSGINWESRQAFPISA
jgi:hypothetical protein